MLYYEDDKFIDVWRRIIDDTNVKHAEDHQINKPHEAYVGIKMRYGHDNKVEIRRELVKRRHVDDEGIYMGSYHNNPIIYSSEESSEIYTVNFWSKTSLLKSTMRAESKC